MKQTIIISIIMVLLIPLVFSAEPTQQFNKIFLDPMYRESFDDGDDYNYTLTVNPPDGFSEVQSAIITFQVWHNPTIRYYLWVNGQTCNTESFLVHTTYANAGEGTIYFDCSNVITESGDYTITLQTDDDTGTSTAWIDMTYTNKPKAKIAVHGTEYSPRDRAKLWVQLLNESGDDLENAVCLIDIYNPVGGIFLEKATMINMHHDGIYYYDLIAPIAQGVYPAIAKCYYDISQINQHASGFTLYTGKVTGGSYVSTWNLDGNEHKIEQVSGKLDIEYDIGNMCGLNISEDFLTSVTVTINAKWKDSVTNDDLIIHWYNYSSGNYVELPNNIIDPNDRITVTNTINTNNLTRDGIVNGAGTMLIRINDTLPTQGGNKKVEMDWLQISCNQFDNPQWTEVKGSSEMHVSGVSNEGSYWVIDDESILGNITNETYEGYMYFNMVVSSQSSQLEEEQDIYKTLPIPFPCHHVLNVSIDNVDTEWFGHSSGTEACEVHWYMDINEGINYNIEILTENWWKQQIYAWESEIDMLNDYVSPMCWFYQMDNDLPAYIIPKQEILDHSDNFYRNCYNTLDYYYHLNKTIMEEYSFPQATLTFEQMQRLNADWIHLVITKEQYLSQVNSLLDSLGLSTDMSVIALESGQALSFFNYWSNHSTPYLIYTDIQDMVNGSINLSIDNSGVATQVWNYDNRTLSTFDFDVTDEVSIWSYINRSLSEPVDLTSSAINLLSGAVWNWSGFINTNILDLFTINIWSYVNRTLTSFDFNIPIDEVKIAENVWNYSERNLTYFPPSSALTEEEIWNYTNRTLTSFDFDVVNEQEISNYVWNNTNRVLTYYWTNNITPQEIWDYDNRTLTFYEVNNISTMDIWNYNNRTLTTFKFDVMNETLVAKYVWNNSDRNLTFYPQTNNITPQLVWEYVNRTLTDFNFFIPINAPLVAKYVWNSTENGRYTHGVILN